MDDYIVIILIPVYILLALICKRLFTFVHGYEKGLEDAKKIRKIEEKRVHDKIKAEIEGIHLIGYATVDGKRKMAKGAVMQILDKYKTESEEAADEQD